MKSILRIKRAGAPPIGGAFASKKGRKSHTRYAGVAPARSLKLRWSVCFGGEWEAPYFYHGMPKQPLLTTLGTAY